MSKLSLKADPTFSHPVSIPRPGADAVAVVFTFKHRDREALDRWLSEELPARAEKVKDAVALDAALVMDCVTGWELEDKFTEANVTQLIKSYGGAALAIYQVYLEQLRLGKQKN